PLSPGGRGSHEFANITQGLSLEKRNTLRQQILTMDRATLARVAERYLAPENRLSAIGIMASEEALKKANDEVDGLELEITTL
ncbi:MAG: hypothetical protein P8X63_04875, partial [Desulfuromonadaceae bacterium]